MQPILLLGAGFSRNWGGWLASEAFEYLLGCPEISQNQHLLDLLWKNQTKVGFENALSEVQADFNRDPTSNKKHLDDFQSAVSRMFDDMNKGFFDTRFEFQNGVRMTVQTFLERFLAIFTLNQDLLLEHHYVSSMSTNSWNGAQLPGMRHHPDLSFGINTNSWAKGHWEPLGSKVLVEEKRQPYFKLHGSSNWRDTNGGSMLIMGGNKAHEIGLSPILKLYHEEFETRLLLSGTRLMVIGYGFLDDHINSIIFRAVEKGLKMFIIDPNGAELAMSLNRTRGGGMVIAPTPLEGTFQQSLIGASRRPLREIFGSDMIEHDKVMRFFQG